MNSNLLILCVTTVGLARRRLTSTVAQRDTLNLRYGIAGRKKLRCFVVARTVVRNNTAELDCGCASSYNAADGFDFAERKARTRLVL
jgi:hypothetical protein